MSTAWQDALDRLPAERPAALELLGRLAFLAPEPIDERLLAEHDAGPEVLSQLVEQSLLVETANGTLALPAMVAQAIHERLDDSARREACTAAVAAVQAAFPDRSGEFQSWPACAALLPHALAVADHALELGIEAGPTSWLLDRAARYVGALGENRVGALELAERAADAARQANDDVLLGNALYAQGRLQSALGDYAAARESLDQALALHRAEIDAASPEVAEDHLAQAELLLHQGEEMTPSTAAAQTEQALSAVEQARAILAQSQTASETAKVDGELLLGWATLQADDNDAAKAQFEHAREFAEQRLGPDRPEVSEALSGLGMALAGLGDNDAAVLAHEQALEILERALGPENQRVAVTRSLFSDSLRAAGRLRSARAELELALAATDARLPEHQRIRRIRHRKLAAIVGELRDVPAARLHNRRAVAISEQVYGRDSLAVAHDLVALAGSLMGSGDTPGELPAARIALTRALDIHIAEHGRDHPATALVRIRLGWVLSDLGSELAAAYDTLGVDQQGGETRAAARKAFLELLEGELEHDEAETLLAVATAAIGSGAPAIAERALERAADARDAPADRSLGATWHLLGRAYRDASDPAASWRSLQTALRLLDGDPQFVGVVLHDLADLRRAQGRMDDARNLFAEAADRKREAGRNVADLATTLLALAHADLALTSFDLAATSADEAVEILRAVDKPKPGDLGSALVLAARAHIAAGDPGQALACAEESRKLLSGSHSPLDLAAATGLVAAASDLLGNPDAARAIVEAELDDPELLVVAAEASVDTGALALVEWLASQASTALDGTTSSALEVRLGRTWHRIGRVHKARAGADLSDEERNEELDAARRAYQEALPLLSSEPQGRGVILHDLANVARARRDYDEAIDLYRQALACKRESDSDDPGDVGETLMALARTLESDKQYEEAYATYEERLKVLESLPEHDYQAEGVVLHDLGDIHRSEGRPEEALELYRRALERKRKAGERGDADDLATTLMALARTLEANEQYDEAYSTYQELLGQLVSTPERDLATEGVVLRDLGDVRRSQDRFAEAIQLYRQALERTREAGGETEDLAVTLLSLGACELVSRRFHEARAAADEALAILDGIDGEPLVRISALALAARCALDAGAGEDAVPLFEEADRLIAEGSAVEAGDWSAIKRLLADAYAASDREEEARATRAEADAMIAGG